SDVLALAGFAQAVTLDGVSQDDRRLSAMLHRRSVGRVDLDRIVAAAFELGQLIVGQVLDELQQFRIFAEELFADVGAAFDRVFLIFAVNDLAHALHEQAGLVALQERVPIAAPNDLDAVPARAAEGRLQLLDDLAVAAHRAVETLQVAVDHPD